MSALRARPATILRLAAALRGSSPTPCPGARFFTAGSERLPA